ncbi:recombinase RecA [Haloferax sp. Atlit-4N]|uniref:ATPase domain-containing protein n=1 Tax=Haloferax TaxID=2251 RepID=UPI0009DA102E|nr:MULTISPECIES: ATPase domain-containing protein [Haloferax]RDZ53173.1 recombinase RecA [Haloferax sp. Atlit-4N]
MDSISSGIPGLDTVLHGGFARGRMYLVRGEPGAGKSLLGAHFLEAGLEADESVVYMHGEESKENVLLNAKQVDIDISGAHFLDLGPETEFFTEDQSYDLVEPGDVQSERITEDIMQAIEEYDPSRILIDPITQIKYIETDQYQYRKRLLSLMRYLRDRETTVVGTLTTRSDDSGNWPEDAESLSDGLLDLTNGTAGRRCEVKKHRGLGQEAGTHGLEIRAQGLEVYPRVVPQQRTTPFDPNVLTSGNDSLDALLGGGVREGSVTFISGPSGVGKTTTGTQFLHGVASQGKTTLGFLFEESTDQFSYRAEKLGTPVRDLVDRGLLELHDIEPLVRSPEEFAQLVLDAVERRDPEIVLIDGIAGYKMSIQGDDMQLVRRLHTLTRTLKQRDISVIITDEVGRVTGVESPTSAGASYLADNVVFLSYVEQAGGMERMIGVLKKRLGDFDNQFHRFTIEDAQGLQLHGPFETAPDITRGLFDE